MFKTSLHTPLILQAPGKKVSGESKALVEFVDIYPTLCELAGLPIPDTVQGKSMVPLLSNLKMPWKEAVFARYRNGDSINTDRYLYTEWEDGARMLYDHQKDPDETVNISENPENAQMIEKLSRQLEKHRKEIKAKEMASGLQKSGNVPPVWKSQKFKQKEATAGQPYKNYINWRVSDTDGDELVYSLVRNDWSSSVRESPLVLLLNQSRMI
jgi:hypothetical protein